MESFLSFAERTWNGSQPHFLIATTAAAILALSPSVRCAVASLLGRLHLSFLVARQSCLPPSRDDAEIIVSALYIHPVKSLRAAGVQEAVLDTKGFCNDRQFMLVTPAPLPIYGEFLASDATHRFLTQRTCPSLATIAATIQGDTLTLTYQLPGNAKSSMEISTVPPTRSATYRASLWDDLVRVRDLGDEVAAFLQTLVNTDNSMPDEQKREGVRLVVQDVEDGRTTERKYTPASVRSIVGNATPSVGLQDGFPLLIASESSLKDLNSRLIRKGKDPIPMSRFRPNIVVSGDTLTPFDEDNWKVIRINGVVLHLVKGCPRCKQSCTDQESGKLFDEPLATLMEYRALGPIKEDVFFCQNVTAGPGSAGSSIYVGARVEVLQRGKPIWKLCG